MTTEPCVVGVDFGTLSGRAVVVRVSDGAELGSAVHEYAHAVMDAQLTAGPAAATDDPVALPPDWALQVPQDYVDVLRNAVPAAVEDAGVDPADVVGIGTDFTACTVLPVLADGTPLCELPEYADRPHAYVKLWKHHAAQPHADRVNELAHRRGESWIGRYGGLISSEWEFAEGVAAARGGPRALRPDGPLRRGRRLDRLAAHRALRPQRLHRRLQGNPPGRPLPDPGVPEGAEPLLRGLRGGEARPRDRRAGRRRRFAERRGRGVDGTAGRHRGRGRQRGRPRHRAGGAGDDARPDGRDHGHLDLPRHEPRPAGRGPRYVRRGRRRHRPRPVRLRGRPVRRRRHLRVVRQEPGARQVRRGGGGRGSVPPRAPDRSRLPRAGRCPRPGGARLALGQPVGPRRPRALRRGRRPDPRHDRPSRGTARSSRRRRSAPG